MASVHQVRDAPDEDGGLSGAGAGDDQQRPVHVFDGLALAVIRLERRAGPC